MKGKKTNLRHADCAIARALQATGDWWSLLIVRDAIAGKQRFGEVQKSSRLAKISFRHDSRSWWRRGSSGFNRMRIQEGPIDTS